MYAAPNMAPPYPSAPNTIPNPYSQSPPTYVVSPPIYSQPYATPPQPMYYTTNPSQVYTIPPAPPAQVYCASTSPPPNTIIMPSRTVEVTKEEGLSNSDVCCLAGLASLVGLLCISSSSRESDN